MKASWLVRKVVLQTEWMQKDFLKDSEEGMVRFSTCSITREKLGFRRKGVEEGGDTVLEWICGSLPLYVRNGGDARRLTMRHCGLWLWLFECILGRSKIIN